MPPATSREATTAPERPLTAEEVRWLHDKYERLAVMEGNLLAGRTSYFATICAVLITGLVFALVNFLHDPPLLAISATFLASIGITLSIAWEILVHRTTGAQRLWREAALRLEDHAPPLSGALRARVTTRSGAEVDVDLLRPYHAHQARFSAASSASWMERIDPSTVSEVLPISFVATWTVVLVVIWSWVLFST